jgi:hypothetical protein
MKRREAVLERRQSSWPHPFHEMKIMIRSTNIQFVAGAMLTLHASASLGQRGAGGREDAWGFVNARYDTRSSTSIYTGYGWRHVFAMGAVLKNPRSGDAELLGGVGTVFKTGADAEHWLALATLRSGAVSFTQLYWLPTVRMGAVTTRAQVKWSIPGNGGGPQKLSISPVSLTLPRRRLAGGLAVEMAAAKGTRTSIGTGLELRLKLPGAAFGADALHDVPGNGARLRLFFASVF